MNNVQVAAYEKLNAAHNKRLIKHGSTNTVTFIAYVVVIPTTFYFCRKISIITVVKNCVHAQVKLL